MKSSRGQARHPRGLDPLATDSLRPCNICTRTTALVDHLRESWQGTYLGITEFVSHPLGVSLLQLTAVRVHAVAVPVHIPTRISTRVLSAREYLVIEIEADDLVGIGYSYIGTRGAAALAEAVREILSPIVLASDPTDILGVYDRLYQETLLTGRRGMMIRALSAIDIALWDLAGKRRNAPLAELLGGCIRAVPAYASGGYYRGDESAAAQIVAEEIEENRRQGFRDHKIKVGGLSIAGDADRVAAGIAAIGPEGRLALDANNAYPNAHEALRAIRAFERAAGDHGLWWMEEPLSPDDIAGHAELARAVETPIATGEIAQTRYEFRALIETKAADILQPDAGVLGGISEWIRVARTAESFQIPVAPHWHANLHVHLAAASPNALTVEHFDLSKDIYNFEELVTPDSRLIASEGKVICPDRPGLGIEIDHDALSRFAITR